MADFEAAEFLVIAVFKAGFFDTPWFSVGRFAAIFLAVVFLVVAEAARGADTRDGGLPRRRVCASPALSCSLSSHAFRLPALVLPAFAVHFAAPLLAEMF